MLPLAYVETNWLIALLFPHDERHEHAREFLKRAEALECEVRVPHLAFLEAHTTMQRVSLEFQQEIARLQDKLSRAYRSGWQVFEAGYRALDAKVMGSYLQRDLHPLLQDLASNEHIHQFASPAAEELRWAADSGGPVGYPVRIQPERRRFVNRAM